jgi:hypothetical protein
MISQEHLNKVNAALTEACPLASNDPASVAALKDKIQGFCRDVGQPPSELTIIQWCVPFEQSLLKKKADAEEAVRQKQARIDARKKEKEFDKLPASEAKARANAELRQQREQTTTERFTPVKTYSQTEIDSMTDAEARKLLFGIESEALNESRPDPELRKVLEKRLLNTKRGQDTPLRKALRREILEGLK